MLEQENQVVNPKSKNILKFNKIKNSIVTAQRNDKAAQTILFSLPLKYQKAFDVTLCKVSLSCHCKLFN